MNEEDVGHLAKERFLLGMGAVERGDYQQGLSTLEEAIAAGARHRQAYLSAALAMAMSADLSNLDRTVGRVDDYFNKAGVAPEDGEEVDPLAEKVKVQMAEVCLRAMRFHVEEGDKLFFAHESTDLEWASAQRSRSYAQAVRCAAFVMKYPPAEPGSRLRTLELAVHCCEAGGESGEQGLCVLARVQLRKEGVPVAEPEPSQKAKPAFKLSGTPGGVVGFIVGAIGSFLLIMLAYLVTCGFFGHPKLLDGARSFPIIIGGAICGAIAGARGELWKRD